MSERKPDTGGVRNRFHGSPKPQWGLSAIAQERLRRIPLGEEMQSVFAAMFHMRSDVNPTTTGEPVVVRRADGWFAIGTQLAERSTVPHHWVVYAPARDARNGETRFGVADIVDSPDDAIALGTGYVFFENSPPRASLLRTVGLAMISPLGEAIVPYLRDRQRQVGGPDGEWDYVAPPRVVSGVQLAK